MLKLWWSQDIKKLKLSGVTNVLQSFQNLKFRNNLSEIDAVHFTPVNTNTKPYKSKELSIYNILQ